jgi:hypothetical protein
MTTQFVQLNAAGTAVVTAFGCAQPVTSDKPGYTTIDSSDARWIAFQALLAAQQSFAAAVLAGVVITSTATPALNGTYPCDRSTQQDIVSEQVFIASESTFTNGGTTIAWPDITGTFHSFPSTTEFTAFAKAIGQYVQALKAALATAQAGGAYVAPSNAFTIP